MGDNNKPEAEIQFVSGKKPATYSRHDLQFHDFAPRAADLPIAPVGFGHYKPFGYGFNAWGMLGNDEAGDCVFAGGGHEHMLLNKMNKVDLGFTTPWTLGDYSMVTGYVQGDPNTDNGTDMRTAMNFRRKTGLADGHGVRHKIIGYVALEPGNWQQHLSALYIFDCVAVGIEFPQSAMDQFNAGKPWTLVSGSPIEGGHYIPFVGHPYLNYMGLVTWGTYKRMSKAFFQKYNDESYAFITKESLSALAHTPEGFDLAGLQAAIAAI